MTEAIAAEGNLENPHAERMDRMYRYQRHIYDLTRKYYLLGRDETIRGLEVPAKGSVLEVGCGTGRNLLLVQKHFPDAQLFGLDISAEMLTSAKAKFEGSDHAPVLAVADATAFTTDTFDVGGFDRVLISYALSMIPDWQRALDCAIAALSPNGSLHIVDFGQQERLPDWFSSILKRWLARFHVTPRADLRAVLEQKAKAAGMTLEFSAPFRGYAWKAVLSHP